MTLCADVRLHTHCTLQLHGFVTFAIVVVKYPGTSNLTEKEFIWFHSLRVPSIMVEIAWWPERGQSVSLYPEPRRQGGTDGPAQLASSILCSIKLEPRGWYCPLWAWAFLFQLTSKINSHMCAQRLDP